MHYENFIRLITKATEDKTLIKLVRDKDDHVFNEIYEDDDMFSNEYENALNHIISLLMRNQIVLKKTMLGYSLKSICTTIMHMKSRRTLL